MEKLADKPAYPFVVDGHYRHYESGMTLREHYAGLAMQGLLQVYPNDICPLKISAWAVEQADALIAELEKGE